MSVNLMNMYDNLTYIIHYESGACGNFLASVVRNHVYGFDIVLNEFNNAHYSKVIINYSKPDFMIGNTGLESSFELKEKFEKNYAFLDHIKPLNDTPIIAADHHSLGSARYDKIKNKWPNLKMLILTMTEEDMWQAGGNWILKTKLDFDDISKKWWKDRPVSEYPYKWPENIQSLNDISVQMIYYATKFRVERHKRLLGWNTQYWMYDKNHPNLQYDFIHFLPFRLLYTNRQEAMKRFCSIFNIPITLNLENVWNTYMNKNIELAKKWMPFIDPVNGNLINEEIQKII